MSERCIGTIHFGGVVNLTAAMVWPDGDAPEEITAEAIAEVMRSCGSQHQVIADWNLGDYLYVDVTSTGSDCVNEVWKGPYRV